MYLTQSLLEASTDKMTLITECYSNDENIGKLMCCHVMKPDRKVVSRGVLCDLESNDDSCSELREQQKLWASKADTERLIRK